jgi:hypothetical protein
MSERPTPETDAAISDGVEMLTNQSDSTALYQKLCDAFCEIQGLRRERDEARHKLELCMAANSDVARIAKERDEARDALMQIEDLFIDGTDIYADRETMGIIAREALEGAK